MQQDLLVVLHCQVVPCTFQVCHLHEKTRNQCLANIGVVVLAVKVPTDHLHTQTRAHTNLVGGRDGEVCAWGVRWVMVMGVCVGRWYVWGLYSM